MDHTARDTDPDAHDDGSTERFLNTVNHLSRQNIKRCWHCWSCGGGCPFAGHMDRLPNQVIREGRAVPEMDILKFHRYIYGSIKRHGRLNKLEAMVQFKLGSGRILSALTAGLKMLTRGKLERFSRQVADQEEMDRIFDHYDHRRKSFDAHEDPCFRLLSRLHAQHHHP